MTADESTKYLMIIENVLNKIKSMHGSCCDGLKKEIDDALEAVDRLSDKIDDDYWALMETQLGPDF